MNIIGRANQFGNIVPTVLMIICQKIFAITLKNTEYSLSVIKVFTDSEEKEKKFKNNPSFI